MRYRFEHRGTLHDVSIQRRGLDYQAVVDGQVVQFEVISRQPGHISLLVGDKPATVHIAEDKNSRWVSLNGCVYRLDKPTNRRSRPPAPPADGEEILAPMPAQVTEVPTVEGDEVRSGQVLMLLEAMKMEIRIKASSSGKVTRITARPGEKVERGQLLAVIELKADK